MYHIFAENGGTGFEMWNRHWYRYEDKGVVLVFVELAISSPLYFDITPHSILGVLFVHVHLHPTTQHFTPTLYCTYIYRVPTTPSSLNYLQTSSTPIHKHVCLSNTRRQDLVRYAQSIL